MQVSRVSWYAAACLCFGAFVSLGQSRADNLVTSAQVLGQFELCLQSGTTAASCSASGTVLITSTTPDTVFFGGIAAAHASFGVIGTSAAALDQCNVTTDTVSCLDGGTVSAVARFSDLITINNAPSSGALDFSIETEGFESTTCVGPDLFICGNSFASTALEVPSTEILDGIVQEGVVLQSGDSFHDLRIPFRSTLGIGLAGLTLGLDSEVHCEADNTTNCSAGTDFIDTAKITGVKVLDGNGNVDSAATLTSLSGTNYNALGTTPEPSSLLLLGAGLLSLRVSLRKRDA